MLIPTIQFEIRDFKNGTAETFVVENTEANYELIAAHRFTRLLGTRQCKRLVPEHDEARRARTAFTREELLRCPLRLAEWGATHRGGVVHGQHQRIRRAERPYAGIGGCAPILEQAWLCPFGEEHGDAYLREELEVGMANLRLGRRRRERRQREEHGD